MVIPILRLSITPTINDNPGYKKCLWLDTSLTPHMLKFFDESTNEWKLISDSCSKNLNPNDPITSYKTWVGTKEDFEALDRLESNIVYSVKGIGEFIGNIPVFESISGVKFVNSSYNGKRNIGVSWEFPFTNIQDALDSANDGDQIWVARGTYTNERDSDNCYAITKKVELYGGFKGTEHTLAERSIKAKTVLTGNGSRRLFNNAADGVVIDGFRFEDGVSTAKGGAIFSTREIEVRYCEFVNNKANYGGALANVTKVVNCLFINNTCTINGNAIYLSKLGSIINCTIVKGKGSNAIYCEPDISIQMYNTVVWTHTSGGDGVVCDDNSLIYNCASTTELGEDNILLSRDNVGSDGSQSYARFTNPDNNDFTLTKDSILVDKGNAIYNEYDNDLVGNPRLNWNSIDIGAFEYQNPNIVRTIAGKTGDVELEISDVNDLQDKLEENSSNLTNHTENKSNPHDVTKDQVGLGNVDNTSDINKPVSTATQTALDNLNKELSQDISEVDNKIEEHIKNTENPHSVTKEQVGLGLVDNTSDKDKPISTSQREEYDRIEKKLDDFSATKNQPNGLASLDENGKLVLTQLPDAATEVLEGAYVNSVTFNDPDGKPYVLETKKLYVDVTEGKNKIYRWDRSSLVELSNQLTLGKGEGQAYPGTAGVELEQNLNEHKADTSNPHKVTKAQVGLDKVDNTPDLKKPISEETQLELNKIKGDLGLKADLVEGKVPISQLPDAILGNVKYQGTWDVQTNEPHLVNGDTTTNGYYYIAINDGIRFGFEFEPGDWCINNNGTWQKVDNVDSVKTVNGKKGIVVIGIEDIAGLQALIDSKANNTDLDSHVGNIENPHKVTKSQIGLGNADNTSDQDKPVSTAQAAAISEVDTKLSKKITDVSTSITDHVTNVENPHNVTKAQIGLDQVDNTSDANKPISTATQNALDLISKSLKSLIESKAIANGIATLDENGKLVLTQLPDSAIEILEGKLVNETTFNDINGSPYTPSLGKLYIDVTENANVIYRWNNSTYVALTNGSDLKKLIDDHISDKSNPHQVTKEQVGLGLVDNTSDLDKPISTAQKEVNEKLTKSINDFKETKDQPNGLAALGVDGKLLETELPAGVRNVIKGSLIDETTFNNASGIKVTPADNVLYLDVTSNVLYAWDGAKYVLTGSATKESIGLGNVDNTSDQDKPISKATQDALDKKVNLTEDGKIDESQLPDRIFGCMKFKGMWDANENSPILENGHAEQNGFYYIVRTQGSKFGFNFLTNDIIYNADGTWYRLMGSAARDTADIISIKSFKVAKDTFETGESADVELSWEYDGNVDNSILTQTINNDEIDSELRNTTISGVTTDTDFVLATMYGMSNTNAKLSVKFLNKIYFGSLSDINITDESLIEFNSEWDLGNPTKNYTINCDGGKYIYFAIPYNNSEKYVAYLGGIEVNDIAVVVRDVTNSSGGVVNYAIYRTINKYNGKLTFKLEPIENGNDTPSEVIKDMYIGGSENNPISTLDGLEKIQISGNPVGSYSTNILENQYAWICVPAAMIINQITSSDFEVPIEEPIVVNYEGNDYKCYRSSKRFKEGEFNFNIK